MKCPNCNHTLTQEGYYSTEQDGDTYINFVSGLCPLCYKWFTWTEIFTLSEITSPEEMKGEE